jgi:hypothetical protein
MVKYIYDVSMKYLSNLDIIISCVWLADVRAEKLTTMGKNFSLGRLIRWLRTIAVLPVPVGPIKRTGIFASTDIFKKNDWHADSVV